MGVNFALSPSLSSLSVGLCRCHSALFVLRLLKCGELVTDPNLADCRKEADVVFVIDSTSNLLKRDFVSYVLGTIVDIIRRLTVDSGRTRVAAVQFTSTAKVRLRHVSSVTKLS